jgi:spore germination cell wall hydrolase CwlJ-like protein
MRFSKLTAAVAALSISSFGAFVAFGSAQAVWANETSGPVQSELLPKSVVEQAQTENPAISDFQIPETVEAAAPEAASLPDLVADLSTAELPDREAECLAGAVYFEAKGESLDGQLAVAQTILNRTRSGRFPTSVCGVVMQPSQFSFVRGGGFPPIARSSRHWKNAVAIAHIARNDLWDSSVDNALYFHARRVNPGWNLRKIAALGNHVFYR